MTALLLVVLALLALLAADLAALRYGADSRGLDPRDRPRTL